MNMRLHEQVVPLEHIHLDDATYKITTRSGIEDLISSITHLGIVHAPILQPLGDRWLIIAGFRRIAACRAARLTNVSAKVLPSDAAEHVRIELAIADNSLQRPLNQIEIARSLTLLSSCHAALGELAVAAANLKLPDNPDLLQKLLRLATLSDSIQKAVLDEVIALSMALTLGDLEESMADEWIRIFRELRVGLNRQRELLTLVAEIAVREDQSAAALLFEPDIREILAPPDTQAAHKYRQLVTHLRKRRFPQITRTTRRFEELVQTLQLGSNARLTPPAHFEAAAYELHLLFRDPEELQRHRQTIEKLLQNPAFKDFMK